MARVSGDGTGDEIGAYVLTDRGTRLAYKGTLRLVPMLADTGDLRNEYSVVIINPARHPDLNHDGARRLADWLLSPAAARIIDGFQVGGQRLFHPVRSGP